MAAIRQISSGNVILEVDNSMVATQHLFVVTLVDLVVSVYSNVFKGICAVIL